MKYSMQQKVELLEIENLQHGTVNNSGCTIGLAVSELISQWIQFL